MDRGNPEIDLIALAAVNRETEVTYIQRERDWLAHAIAEGRLEDPSRGLPALPASLAVTTEDRAQ
jgi:hypothetical protein